jgi:hypothetical protein
VAPAASASAFFFFFFGVSCVSAAVVVASSAAASDAFFFFFFCGQRTMHMSSEEHQREAAPALQKGPRHLRALNCRNHHWKRSHTWLLNVDQWELFCMPLQDHLYPIGFSDDCPRSAQPMLRGSTPRRPHLFLAVRRFQNDVRVCDVALGLHKQRGRRALPRLVILLRIWLAPHDC